ncbi:uncharacterized protein A4U43_C02F14240 [Asparagus officinalis]|uniref:F-box domain-containing protein n=2 Tax=Asparagus officinalis TaxID=4686 RepID=A0A5P1FK42_ASPOF|nr:uncharacterized protein A4U43_C02F14240 [Asparagus officinalis]
MSSVCAQWRKSLNPLREAMVLVRWGKRFKHGDCKIKPSQEKALDSFLRGADRGSAAAMVDAGLMCWEMGRKEEAKRLYARAAEMGYPAAQCNLGLCYLQDNESKPEEAVKWFYRAAESGYARAQYNLGLCLHKGRGTVCSLTDAAIWYLKAAEGGYVRAMYNASLCYSDVEGGLNRDLRRARMWMKRAADHGHSKAQLEHGLDLYYAGDLIKALLYLELATRAGENAAVNARDSILQGLPQTSRDLALLSVDKWKPINSVK